MQFLFPQFLWALTALAVPIIIHLFYFRRYKTVLFSNVRFLREIKEETSARNKLRNLLILMMRCLALAALVLAFAQPFIPVADQVQGGMRNVNVFVDNSFSMQSFGQDLPLLDRAKQRARDVVSAYSQEDKFQIQTHDLSAGQQRYISKEEALALIEDVDITPAVAMLSRVVDRQASLAQKEQADNVISYLISDFQKSITDIDGTDSSMALNLVPVQSVRQENVAIDTAWFDTPAQIMNQTSPLVIKVTNYGAGDVENVKLTMTLDGQEKPLTSLNIPAGGSVTDTAQITILKTGWHEVTLRITDFPVQFDDTWYLTFYVDEQIRVLAVNGGIAHPKLNAAFRSGGHYQLDNQSAAQPDFSAMRTYDLIILDDVTSIPSGMAEALYQYLATTGGRVLLFPAANKAVSGFNDFLSRCNANPFTTWQEGERVVGQINTEEFIFNDVFLRSNSTLRLPVTQSNYGTADLQRSGRERILRYRDGTSFLDKYRVGNGMLLVCSAPLAEDISDLSRNAEIFIPLLYKAAISTGKSVPGAYIIGRDELIEVDASTLETDRVLTFKGATEFIPGMTSMGSRMVLSPGDQVQQAGFYKLFSEETELGTYAFNYDRAESLLDCYSAQELTNQVSGASVLQSSGQTAFAQMISERDKGIQLWKWFIGLALLFLLLEIIAIRALKG